MAVTRTADSTQSRINMIVYGGHGAGKSTFALRAAYLKREDGKPFRILYIDNEMGSVDDYLDELKEDGIDLRNIVITYTTSLGETRQLVKQAAAKETFEFEDGTPILDADGEPFVPDMVVVDGASVLYQSSVQARREFSKQRATVRVNKKENVSAQEAFVSIEGADIEIKDYSSIKFEGKALILDLTGSGLHYVVTAREKEILDRKVIKVNGVDKEVTVSTGRFEPEGFNDIGYNGKTIARFWRDETDGMIKMKCSKDRTHTFKEGVEIEDPSILEFQKMINKNNERNRKSFAPKNTMKEDIKREMEAVEREILGTTIAEFDTKTLNPESVLVNEQKVQDFGLEELKAEYKALYETLNPVQKESFKGALVEKGLKGVSTKGLDADGVKTRMEILKEILK